MELYIGVDGGGTKTEVVLYDADGQTPFVITGGPSNPNTVGIDSTVSVVMTLVHAGLRELNNVTVPGARADRGHADRGHAELEGVEGSESGEGSEGRPRSQDSGSLIAVVRGVSLGMSGVDRMDQISALAARFQAEFPYAQVEVTNDALAALTAGTHGKSGVVLIAGTGSIAVGESWRRTIARAGGYGSLIGDEGGGFDIGRRGIMAAIQFAEHRGAPTKLWHTAQEVFMVQEPGELIPKVYNSVHPVGTVASFARHVLEAAPDDNSAMDIVKISAKSFVGMIRSVRQQLADEVSNRIVLAGGLFTHTAVLRNVFEGLLRDVLPNVVCEPLIERPSAGAVLRSLRMVHEEHTDVPDWQQAMGHAIHIRGDVKDADSREQANTER